MSNEGQRILAELIICAVFGYSIYQEALAVRVLIRTLDLDPDTFESTYHHNIRLHIAEHLGDYLSQTDPSHDELYAVLRNRSPISLGLLGRLSAGQSRKQKHILERAAGRFLP